MNFRALILLLGCIPLDAAEDELDPLVITTEEEESLVPGATTSLDRQELENSNAGTVAELLEFEAGLPFTSFFGTPGLGSPVIRGFAENSSSRILVLVDGLPVARPDLGVAPWFQFPVNSLERVTLLRGSRTVRYGSSALGGVIALETRRATHKPSATAEAAAGGFETFRFRFFGGMPLGDWGVTFSAEDERSDGYRDNSAYRTTAGTIALESPQDAPLTARWTLSANDLFYENPGALSTARYVEDPTQSIYDVFGVGDQYFNEIKSLRATQQLHWDFAPEWGLDLDGSLFERQRELNFGAGSVTDNTLRAWHLESVLTWEREGTTLQAGLRGHADDLELTRYTDLERQNPFGRADLRRDLVGVFLIGKQEVVPGWTVTGGAGWEHYRLQAEDRGRLFQPGFPLNFAEETSDDGLSFEASLQYEDAPDRSAWLRYDRVYRFPVMDEIAAYQGFLLTEPFNADLEPERGHNLEVGARWAPGPWELGITAYSLWLNGEIAYDFEQNLNVNFSDTHRYGLETQVAWDTDQWRLRVFHAATFAHYASGPYDGRRIPLVPRHTLSGSITWSPFATLALSVEGRYAGSSPEGNDFANTEPSLPAHEVFNSQIRWFPDEQVELFLRVNNLFDRRYASLKYLGQWYPAPGRQFIAGARIRF